MHQHYIVVNDKVLMFDTLVLSTSAKGLYTNVDCFDDGIKTSFFPDAPSVKASLERSKSSEELLVDNAQGLLQAVSKTVRASEAACLRVSATGTWQKWPQGYLLLAPQLCSFPKPHFLCV